MNAGTNPDVQLQGNTKIISIVFVLLPNWMKRAIKKKQRQATLSPPIKTLSHYQIYKKTFIKTQNTLSPPIKTEHYHIIIYIKTFIKTQNTL